MTEVQTDVESPKAPEAEHVVIYLVAWSGGYEQPSFEFFTDEAQAQAKFDEHKADFRKGDGDDLSFLKYDATADQTELIDSYVDGVDNS
jgi:hypothetical protein